MASTPVVYRTPLEDRNSGNASGENSPKRTAKTAAPAAASKNAFVMPSTIRSRDGVVYSVGKPLGKGGFASCYMVTDIATNQTYAAKVVLKSSLTKSATRKKLKSEIDIHRQLKHKHIVQFINSFDNEDAVFLILGLCENNTLTEMLRARKRLTDREVQYFGLQLLAGLKYLHEDCLILHRDLKLGNLMLTKDMELKIGDFGLAASLESPEDRRQTVCGTPNYIAPEVLDGAKTGGHSYEVDVWGFGVVLYTLLVGSPPFETTNVKSTYKKIQEGSFEFPADPTISESFKDLIYGILQKDPDRRFTLSQIASHRFFLSPPPPTKLPVSALSKEPKNLPTNPPIQQQLPPMMTPTKSASTQPIIVPAREECVLRELHNRLEKSLAESKHYFQDKADQEQAPMLKRIATPSTMVQGHSELNSVVRYVEFSMYGTGYLMKNGVLGVKFNDLSWIGWPLNGKYFAYLEKNVEASYGLEAGKYPSTLQKKVRLLDTFKQELLKGFDDVTQLPEPSAALLTSSRPRFSDLDWVRKCHKTNCAMFFRLGNGTVQVKFLDRSDLVFNCATHTFNYTSKYGVHEVTTMDQVIEQRRGDIYRRVLYLNNLLAGMIEKRSGHPV